MATSVPAMARPMESTEMRRSMEGTYASRPTFTSETSGPVDSHRDRAEIPAGGPAPERELRLASAVDIDGVVGVPGRPIRPPRVRRAAVDAIGEGVGEEQLPGVHDVSLEMHLDVDVHGSTLVPARVDGPEGRDPACVGSLDSAHEGSAAAACPEARVVAGGVGVPDVDRGALDRLAG